MSMEWMIPDRTARRSAFIEQWRVNAHAVANRPPKALGNVADVAVQVIMTTENLRLAWDWLKMYGGIAPGPNGQTFRDFTRVGAWKEIERLQDELKSEK